jgi:hypothetical protein
LRRLLLKENIFDKIENDLEIIDELTKYSELSLKIAYENNKIKLEGIVKIKPKPIYF